MPPATDLAAFNHRSAAVDRPRWFGLFPITWLPAAVLHHCTVKSVPLLPTGAALKSTANDSPAPRLMLAP